MTKILEQLKRGDVLIYYSDDIEMFALFISCEIKVDYSWNMVPQYCFIFYWLNCCGFVENFTFFSPDKNYMLFASSKNKNIISQKQNVFFYLDD